MTHEKVLASYVGANLEIKQDDVNDYRINYVTTGKGQPLILLHGLNIGWGQWYRNISELAEHYTVYALDLPGSGGSTKIDFATSNLENDLVETVEKFIEHRELNNVVLVGHSIGAWVAMRLAIEHGDFVDKLVLSNPLGLVDYVPLRHMPLTFPPIAKFLSEIVVRPNRDNMANFLASVCCGRASVEDGFIDYFYESIHRGHLVHPFMVMNRLFDPLRLRREFVLISDLHKIKTKTLIIVGSDDFLVPHKRVEKVLGFFKSAKMKVLLNTGHVPFIEDSSLFNNAVLEFLSEK